MGDLGTVLNVSGYPKGYRMPSDVFRSIVPDLDISALGFVTPEPPPLSGPPDVMLRSLASAWTLVANKITRKVHGTPKIARSNRNYNRALEVAKDIANQGVSAVAYQLAAFNYFPKTARKPIPGFAWTLFPAVYDNNIDIAKGTRVGGRLVKTRELKNIIHRYHYLMGKVIRERPNEVQLRSLIQRVFPGGFRGFEIRARCSSVEAEARFNRKLSSGKWPW